MLLLTPLTYIIYFFLSLCLFFFLFFLSFPSVGNFSFWFVGIALYFSSFFSNPSLLQCEMSSVVSFELLLEVEKNVKSKFFS